MKIAIDLDDTVWGFYNPFSDFYFNKSGIRRNEMELASDFWGSIGTKEEGLTILKEFFDSGEGTKLKFFDDFLENFEELKNKFEIVFVTSRSYDLREETKKIITNHLGVELDIVYTSDYNPNKKSYVCDLLGIDILIDDFPNNALDCAEKGINVLLIDKPWNKKVDHENVYRCEGWKGILSKLNEMKTLMKNE